GKYKGNELRFINHSNDPNTQCLDVLVDNVFYMIYIAIRDIAKDEELTVSYGSGYWDSRKINPH
ncbi:SET domain-containing protein-lysine N-methyltransferase, partial [Candidatus Babeliales bacterium]|nr:SET domain-containing protein-lysine N-methyltransferase [Candidatus Babeliales bacterium]